MSGESTREKQLLADVRKQAEALSKLAATVVSAAAANVAAATANRQDLQEAADSRRDGAVAAASASTASDLAKHQAVIHEVHQSLASGAATAGWRSNDWYELPAATLQAASTIRLGQASLSATNGLKARVSVPLLAPLLNTGNVVLVASEHDDREVASSMNGLVLRALAGTGPGQLNIVTCDPKIRGTFADLRELRNIDSDLFPAPCTSADEIASALQAAARDVARIRELLGGRHRTLGELRAAAGQPIEAYKLIVLLDFPTNVSADAFDLAMRLLESGPACGTSLVIHLDPKLSPPRDRDAQAILQHGFGVQAQRGARTVALQLSGFDVDLDAPPPLELVGRVVQQVAEVAKTGAAPAIPFRDLVSVASIPSENSTHGISAIIGRSGTDAVTITLGDPVEQRHNILVAGAVGQGKSNLLLVLIHSLASRYSAGELEMYLLDFKEGLEFSQLTSAPGREHWLPNARVLGLESDREFGVAVLDHLIDEFNRRAALIKPHGNNIARYREASPKHVMPRLLVVIDEFQVLLAEEDELADKALQALETLARRTRAVGMHLVLASQTLSGIRKLALVEGAIFGQFPTRLALKTSATESQVVLANGNTDASKLRYRGEVVVNHEFGSTQGNTRAIVAYADERDLDELRSHVWTRRARGAKPPVVFYGNRPSPLTAGDGSRRIALLGTPVGVEADPIGFVFSDEPGRHLAIIGDGSTTAIAGESAFSTNMAFGAIHGAVASLASFHEDSPARFLVLDFLSAAQRADARLDELSAAAARTCDIEQFQGIEATAALRGLKGVLQQRSGSADEPPTYVVAIGLHRAPRMDEAGDNLAPSASDTLREIISNGPLDGLHLIGWWGNYKSFSEHVNYEVDGYVKGILALKIPAADAGSLFGPFTSWVPRDHRGLFIDRDNFAAPRTIVPFAPATRPLAA